MPSHIYRLIIVFVIFITISVVIRHLLIPKSFGQLGHYRALSLKENADKEIKYAEEKLCIECHDDIGLLKSEGPHTSVKCEVCHEAGFIHCNEPEISNIKKPKNVREFCGKCHSMNIARNPDIIVQINIAEHNIENNCTDCHNPHEPWHEMK